MQLVQLQRPGHRKQNVRQVAWTDVDVSDSQDRDWLQSQSDLSESTKALLLEPVKSSRRESLDEGLFVGLCSLAPTDGDSDDDETRVSIGVLVGQDRVVTVRFQPLVVVEDLHRQVQAGSGPTSPLQLLAALVIGFKRRLETLVTKISQDTDELEDLVLADNEGGSSVALDALRSRILLHRRYFVRSQSVLRFIISDPTMGLSRKESEALRSASELVNRYVETLQDCRDRAMLLHDHTERQLANRAARTTNDLTIIATVFLPLTFITGLLGMNVAGIPESHNPGAFWLVCIGLVVVGVVSWVLLRLNK